MDFKSGVTSPWTAAQQSLRSRAQKGSNEHCTQPLQMYLVPPTGDVSLEEFDGLAVERLQVLRTLERAGHLGKPKFSSEWADFVLADLKRQKLSTYEHLLSGREDQTTSTEAQRRDLVSHFILRLAYCRTEELRSWFVQHEVDLFRLRFQMQKKMDSNIGKFLVDNGIHLELVSDEERARLREGLLAGTAWLTATTLEMTHWYSVPFVEALDLVRGRRVLLERGRAYIPARDLGSIVAAKFRNHMQHALAMPLLVSDLTVVLIGQMARRLLPVVEEDSRLKTLLNDFDKRYTGQQYSANKDANAVTPDMVDELCKQSFPPCMRQLHQRLRTNHKLLHAGRMQYGLFLKAIGLSLDDAVAFWREEFTKVMEADKFHKQYLYNIRHNYGQEGKRTSYSAHHCGKVLASGGANDSGCPFKHFDRDSLATMLGSYGIDKDGCTEVLELAARSQPQLACQKYWELAHHTPFDGMVQHPNQFYEESRKTFTGARTKTDRGLDKSRITRVSLPVRPAAAAQPEWDDDIDMTEVLELPVEQAAS